MNGFLLHLLRHGAPETPGLFLGQTDAAPTRGGIAACVERAHDLEFDAIVCSDLTRATAAAAAIGKQRDLRAQVDPRWREIDFGVWDGLAAATIDQQALGRFWHDPDKHAPPEGERWTDLVARIETALAGLDSQSTLVVTHGGAMRAALSALCGFDHRTAWAFDLPYAALLSLRVWPGERLTGQVTGLLT